MLSVKELLELADQCAELASDASNREAKNVLQDIGSKFMREADHLRHIACGRDGSLTNLRRRNLRILVQRRWRPPQLADSMCRCQ